MRCLRLKYRDIVFNQNVYFLARSLAKIGFSQNLQPITDRFLCRFIQFVW